jgi:hypothetical protein
MRPVDRLHEGILVLMILGLLTACDIEQPQPSMTPSSNTPSSLTVQSVTATPSLAQSSTVVAAVGIGNQLVAGHITASNRRVFEYEMTIPPTWITKYGRREQSNIVYVEYRGKVGQPETLFSLTALTETEWQAAQKGPHGTELFSSNGIVFMLNIALANPFTDPKDQVFADEFQQWAGQMRAVTSSLRVKEIVPTPG